MSSEKEIFSEKQLETLKTLKKVDENDNLYELDYLCEYNLDELLQKSTEKKIVGSRMRELLYSHIFPNDPSPKKVKNLIKQFGACSSFYCSDKNGNPLLARNMDFCIDVNETNILLHTHPKDGYASVGIAEGGMFGISKANLIEKDQETLRHLLFSPFFICDGINEKGFTVSLHILSEGKTSQQTGKTMISNTMVPRLLLDKVATVEEAIELLQKYDITFTCMYQNELFDMLSEHNFHWIIADASGKRAIIQVVNRKLKVIYNPVRVDYDADRDIGKIAFPNVPKDYLILTNFYHIEGYPNYNPDGYWRYQVLDELLEKNSKLTIEEVFGLLEKVKFLKNDKDSIYYIRNDLGLDPEDPNSWEWATLWSEVFDIANLKVSVALREDFTKIYSFGIKMGDK